MPFTPRAFQGTLHHFSGRLFAFEHSLVSAASTQAKPKPQHTLLFLGGLADDIQHPSYPSTLPNHLPTAWTVAQLHLGSAGQAWTTSSLGKDANDLEKAVRYFRSLPGRSTADGGKIVVMGHSTGAQVCMEYLLTKPASSKDNNEHQRSPIDGLIMQGGISDREGLAPEFGAEKLASSRSFAKQWIEQGRGEDILPNDVTGLVFGASPSARRYVSLTEFAGGDDYFSSDLGAERFARTFGRLQLPVCCLLSELDEHMPPEIDKEALLGAWRAAVAKGADAGTGAGLWDHQASGVVPGASHNLNKSPPEAVADLATRVAAFVGRVENGKFANLKRSGEALTGEKL